MIFFNYVQPVMVVSIIERQFIIARGESKIKKIKIREILLVFAVGG